MEVPIEKQVDMLWKLRLHGVVWSHGSSQSERPVFPVPHSSIISSTGNVATLALISIAVTMIIGITIFTVTDLHTVSIAVIIGTVTVMAIVAITVLVESRVQGSTGLGIPEG